MKTLPFSTIKVSIIIPCYNIQEWIGRALNSIPQRDDIQLVIIDDCSTDKTPQIIADFLVNSTVKAEFIKFPSNQGVSRVINEAMKYCQGEYIYQLDGDDYLYTNEFNLAIDDLDGRDVVYVRARENDGTVLVPNENNHNLCASWFKFIRRDFLGDYQREINVYGGDYEQWLYILQKPHTSKNTSLIVYHYNYPRIGSITWERFHD